MKAPATLVHSVRQRLLAHFEKSVPFALEAPATEAAPADSGQLLYAPVTGRIRALTRIKDPVFSSEVLGKGCAIEPSCGEVVAPADGIVKKIAKTHHAISLLCDNGLEVLIHVGMDTVELKGKGYELFVQAGDHVQKGQLLFRFDLQAIAAAGYTLTTPVIVTNSSRFAQIELLLSGRVTAGQQLVTRQNVKMGQKRPQTFLAHKSYNAFYSVTLW